MMDCTEARTHLLDRERSPEVEAHLRECADCRHEAAAERALGAALDRLPQHEAPAALKRRLAQQYMARPRRHGFVPALAAAVAMALVVGGGMQWAHLRARHAAAVAELEREAVNDHLRVLYSQHPVEIESGGIHQVKPWFEGRLDFAPVVGFAGNDEFPLVGGSVGYFLDRKAAVFVYRRRLHTITLFVFKDDGLAWPDVREVTRQGFHLVLWRKGGLGYALVSDLDPTELRQLAALIAS